MNFETRQYVIDLLNEWDEDLFGVLERTEPTKWVEATEELKQMFCKSVDELLRTTVEEYGDFD